MENIIIFALIFVVFIVCSIQLMSLHTLAKNQAFILGRIEEQKKLINELKEKLNERY